MKEEFFPIRLVVLFAFCITWLGFSGGVHYMQAENDRLRQELAQALKEAPQSVNNLSMTINSFSIDSRKALAEKELQVARLRQENRQLRFDLGHFQRFTYVLEGLAFPLTRDIMRPSGKISWNHRKFVQNQTVLINDGDDLGVMILDKNGFFLEHVLEKMTTAIFLGESSGEAYLYLIQNGQTICRPIVHARPQQHALLIK